MMVSALESPLQRLFPEYDIKANPYPSGILKTVLNLPLIWRPFTSEFQRHFANQKYRMDNSKSKSKLELAYRTLDETLQDTVKSMVDTGFVKARSKKSSS